MNMKKNNIDSIFSYFVTFVIRGGGIVLTFAVSVILARMYGEQISGEYYIAYNFKALIISLTLMGYNYVVVHFCSPFFLNKENQKGNAILSVCAYSVLAVAIIVVLFLALFRAFFSSVIYNNSDYSTSILIVSLMVIPASLLSILAELFKSLGKTNISIITSNIVVYFLFALFIIINNNCSLNILLIKELIANVIAVICMIFLNRKTLVDYEIKIIKLPKLINLIRKNKVYNELVTKFLKENFVMTIISISNVILTVYDTLVIGAMLSATEAALFSVANKITAIGSVCLTTVNAIVGYRFANEAYRDDKNSLDNMMIYYTRILFVLAILFAVIICIGAPVVTLIYGEGYSQCISFIRYLCIGQFILIATGPSAYFLIMTGKATQYRRIVIISAAITIVTSYLGAKFYGIIGVIFSNVLVVSVKNIWSFVMVIKDRKLKVRDFILFKGDQL